MKPKLELTKYDHFFYDTYIDPYLPPKIVDIHTHVYKKEFCTSPNDDRTVNWIQLGGDEQPIEMLLESNKILFPGHEITCMMFGNASPEDNLDAFNNYIYSSSKQTGFPSLYWSSPQMSAEKLEQAIISGNFIGIKSYLTFAPSYLDVSEIRIFDFFPPHHLEVLNKHGWILMCHIPRNTRLGDPCNLAQLLEIEEKYPNIRLIVAHIGRAYTPSDIKNAFEVLSKTKNMLFDFSANCLDEAIEGALRTFGPKRLLFGSDAPLYKIRLKRIVENDTYINLIPRKYYGDEIPDDSHLRKVSGPEAEKITFFIYEVIAAFLRVAQRCNLSKNEIEDVFYNNAYNLISKVSHNSI